MPWSLLVDLIRGLLFSLAHVLGGSMGFAIVVASLALRAAMLPLTLRAARRNATAASPKLLPDFGTLSQLPFAIALYSAIRHVGDAAGGFLWVRNLARPDRLLAVLCALVAGAASWIGASAQPLQGAPAGSGVRNAALAASALVAVVMTLGILAHMPAGVALYSVTSSVASLGERKLVGRLSRATRAAAP